MNILLIDNGTIRQAELRSLLRENDIETIEFDQISSTSIENFDLLILSGSSQFPILSNAARYKHEIDLIKNCTKPIIGICLGFELIGYAYGARLIEMPDRENGIIDLEVTNSSGIFNNLPNFHIYESHRWVIKDLPADLVELARSKDGIEIVKHRDRKLYGFQFHPEMFVNKTCGDEIFNNLLAVLK